MSIDPNKAFGMKAVNKAYTLEFRAEGGMTELSVTDMETAKMSVSQRLGTAWAILTGKKTVGELASPIRLRNADFYHLSFIYRPDKEKDGGKKTVGTSKSVTSKTNNPKVETAISSDAPAKKNKAGRKPKTVSIS